MKKYFLFIFCFSCSLVLFAQNEHLSFMDIPIDGTITEFHAKLREKGISHDAKGSSELPIGKRKFKGKFEEERCDIEVSYIPSSKIVYQVKVFVYYDDRIDFAIKKYYSIKEKLNEEFTCVYEYEKAVKAQLLCCIYKSTKGQIKLENSYVNVPGFVSDMITIEYVDTINNTDKSK